MNEADRPPPTSVPRYLLKVIALGTLLGLLFFAAYLAVAMLG